MQSQEINKTEKKVNAPGLAKDKKGLTVTLFIGEKQIDKLTAEQSERMADRLSKTMSRYYSSHLQEFKEME